MFCCIRKEIDKAAPGIQSWEHLPDRHPSFRWCLSRSSHCPSRRVASDEAISKGGFFLEELSEQDKLQIVKGGIGAGSTMKMVHQLLVANQIL
jgi:hypothetical protein